MQPLFAFWTGWASMEFITSKEMDPHLNWMAMVEALKKGHLEKKAEISDQFVRRDDDTLLSRAAWIDNLGLGVKSVTIYPKNHEQGLPTVQGAMTLFDDKTGQPIAMVESELVTKWKTAADSLLGALYLARKDSRHLLIIGSGKVAHAVAEAYMAGFPDLEQISICSRNVHHAAKLASHLQHAGINAVPAEHKHITSVNADIICTATTSLTPVITAADVMPGTHLDLIGAFKSDMREADDQLIKKGRLFVDSKDTTIGHIGELMIPIANNIITKDDIEADLYDLAHKPIHRGHQDITIFKNGGGAHLDLMIAHEILATKQRL